MKKYLYLTILLLWGVCLVTPAQANILDDIEKYVKDHPAKLGLFYDIRDNEIGETVGATIVSDICKVDGLDLDGLVTTFENRFETTDNVAIGLGISYNKDLSELVTLSLGIGGELERIEKLELHRIGEGKYGVYGALKF
jgi:hypothetical protein